MSRYSNHSIKILKSSVATTIGTVTDNSFSLNTDIASPDTGDPYDVFQSIIGQKPEFLVQVEAIKAVLDTVGIFGLCISENIGADKFTIFNQKHDVCGVAGRASGSVHNSIAISECVVSLETLTASTSGNAMATLRIHANSIDNNTPISIVYNVALPTTQIRDQAFALGPPVVAGVELPYITDMTINFNPEYEKPVYAGGIFPKIIDFKRIRATITLTTDDPELMTASATAVSGKIRQTGEQATHANSKIRLRRRKQGEAFYAKTDTEHIEGTFAGLVHVPDPYKASGANVGTMGIEIKTFFDGTNIPIVWSTGIASTAP